MPETDIAKTTVGDMTNDVDDVEVSSKFTDGATGTGETTYQNEKFAQQLGYYLQIPEWKRSVDTTADWITARGYTADDETKVILDRIRGAGDDTFLDIVWNMEVISMIGGDAYCEIIRNEAGVLLNLKPLDTGSMKIVFNSKGMLERYEQVSRTKDGKLKKFKPTDIFRLTNKRIGDSMGGIADTDVIEKIVKARNEAFADKVQLQHRFVRPRFMVELDTDKKAKIDSFIKKFDLTTNKGDNLYYGKGNVKVDLLAVAPNATLNSENWMASLQTYFSNAVGVPEIVMNGSGTYSESGAKTSFTAWEQTVMGKKLRFEQQFSRQVFHDIKFADSVSLRKDVTEDTTKDGPNQQMEVSPADIAPTPAGVEE